MARGPQYCVFRIVNELRKEIFLVATPLPIFDAINELRRSRPLVLRDWDLADITKFESLEFNLTKEQASDFVAARIQKGTARGYKYVLALDFQ